MDNIINKKITFYMQNPVIFKWQGIFDGVKQLNIDLIEKENEGTFTEKGK